MNRHVETGVRIVRGPFPPTLLSLSVLAILWICLRPTAGSGALWLRLCLICGDEGIPNLVLNVLLYLPVGLAVGLRSGSITRATASGFLLSLMIETLQLWVPGRFPGLADLASNTVGAALGGALSRQIYTIMSPPPHRRRLMALTWVAALSAVTVLPGPMLVPSVPEDDIYVGWTPELGLLESYIGRVLSAQLETLRLDHGLLEEPHRIGPALSSGSELRIHFQVGATTSRLAPLLHMSTASQSEILLVGIQSRTLVVRPRVRARDVRLAAPEFRITGLLDQFEPGDTVRLGIRLHPLRAPEVTLGDSVHSIGVSSARGWSLLRFPRAWPDWALDLLDALWVLSWFLPIGLWASSSRVLLAAATLPAGLALLASIWTPLEPPHMLHAAAAVGGLLAGRGLRKSAARIVPASECGFSREDSCSSTPARTGM